MARRLPLPTETTPRVTNLQELGELVRSARARAQLRIDDAAAVSGVSSDLLSRLEHGRPVTSDKLLAVLSSLGLAVLMVDHVRASQIEMLLASKHAPENR
jgi:transcriptional regulator with XRE-family HTH domain